MKTQELEGAALDWAVAKCEQAEGMNIREGYGGSLLVVDANDFGAPANYSTDWAQGGPIIERELSKLFKNVGGTYTAQIKKEIPIPEEDRGTSLSTHYTDWCNKAGPTPLIAAMRCYVASKLGDEVEIPEELC